MIRVIFKTSIEFDDQGWEQFKKKWTMPDALLHSILKSVFNEGFQSKYGLLPKTVGIFPLEPQTRLQAERVGG